MTVESLKKVMIENWNCTTSQQKALSGRNGLLKLLSNRNVFYPAKWGIHERINYKAMYADPSRYYKEFWDLEASKGHNRQTN